MKIFNLVLTASCFLPFLLSGCVSSSEKFVLLDEQHPAAPIQTKYSARKPFLMSGNEVLSSPPVPSESGASHSGHKHGEAANPPSESPQPKGAKDKHDHDHG